MRFHLPLLLLLSLGLIFTFPPKAEAVHTRRLSLQSLTEKADDIYVATVLSAAPLLDPETDSVWTEYVLKIDQTWKGKAIKMRWLRFFGGETDGRSEGIAGQPTLDVGSRYLLFVGPGDRNFAPTVGVGQGIFRIVTVAGENAGADTIELVSFDGERLEIDADHKIARTGPWALVGGVLIEARLLESQLATVESDPDPLLSTGRPSTNRSARSPTKSLRPATLEEIRRWLVEPVLAQSHSAREH